MDGEKELRELKADNDDLRYKIEKLNDRLEELEEENNKRLDIIIGMLKKIEKDTRYLLVDLL